MGDLPLVAVWGAAGHARVVANGIRCQSRYEIAGFIDSVCPLRAGEEFSGSRVLGGVDCLARCRAEGISHLIVAVGDNQARLRLAEEALRHGFELAIVVHPSAVIADGVIVGGGTFVAVAYFSTGWLGTWSGRFRIRTNWEWPTTSTCDCVRTAGRVER